MTIQEAQKKAKGIKSIYQGIQGAFEGLDYTIEEMEGIISIDEEWAVKISGDHLVLERYFEVEENEYDFEIFDIDTLKPIGKLPY